MLNSKIFALILLAPPVFGQATVEVNGTLVSMGEVRVNRTEWIARLQPKVSEYNRQIGGGGEGAGGSGSGGSGESSDGLQYCYGVHDWKIDLNPGMGPITGLYSGRTTAAWEYDTSNKTVLNPSVIWSGSSHGVGVTCEGAITGTGASWTGAWNAKQSTGIVWKEKRMSAIYKLAASLSTFESSVQ